MSMVCEGGLMRVEYDSRIDAAYINLDTSDSGKAARTYACDPAETGGQIQLDFDDAGRLIGIEVLDASHMLPRALLKAGAAPQ
jgi:uncharacterized protein YuzE